MFKKNKILFLRNKYILLSVLFLFFTTTIFIVRGYGQPMSFIGGDEPHYIMMADSLVKDGDFNLKNDYELSRSARYYPVAGLFPHLAPIIDYKDSNRWYSIHTIGLPLLIFLPYKLLGVLGARLLLLMLQLLAVYLFYLVLKKFIQDDKKIFIGMLLLLSCSLFWQNIGGIFPDFFTVLFLEISILLFGRRDLLSNFAFLFINLLGLLLHTKIILLIGPVYLAHNLAMVHSDGFKTVVKRYFAFYALLFFGVLVYVRFLKINYGIISPSQIYGPNGQLFSGNFIINFIAILTDKTKGLLIYFPVLLIAPIYIYRASKKYCLYFKSVITMNTKLSIITYLMLGLTFGLGLLFITQLGFNDWSGSYSPNGRYMMVFVFVIILFIAKYIDYKNLIEISVLATLSFIGFFISLKFIFDNLHYFDTGKIIALTNRIDHFGILPLFPITPSSTINQSVVAGASVLLLALFINIILYRLYAKH